jgi:hypothetical protein
VNALVAVAAAIALGLAILRSHAALVKRREGFRAAFRALAGALARRHDVARRLLDASPADAAAARSARAAASSSLRVAEIDPCDRAALAEVCAHESALSRALLPVLAAAAGREVAAKLASELRAVDRGVAVALHVAKGARVAYSSLLRRPPHVLVAPLFRLRPPGELAFELCDEARADVRP